MRVTVEESLWPAFGDKMNRLGRIRVTSVEILLHLLPFTQYAHGIMRRCDKKAKVPHFSSISSPVLTVTNQPLQDPKVPKGQNPSWR